MPPFTPAFDDLVASKLDQWHALGVAYSVIHGDETWSKAYGVSQLPSPSATPSTIFYAASTTKAQLCAAWTIFINSGRNKKPDGTKRITWTTPLVEVISDDFALQDAHATSAITIEDAVSHRTGMPRHELSYGREGSYTPKEIVRNLRNLPLHNPLRTKFEYCNIMYVAASYALEVAYGKPFAEYMRELLWGPLEMHHTYASLADVRAAGRGEDLARGYTWSKLFQEGEGEGGYIEEKDVDLFGVSGAGSVMSTAVDYAKWMRALLSGSGPLTPEITKELWTPRAIPPLDEQEGSPYDGLTHYCLGWYRASYRGHKIVWHGGDVTGFGSTVILLPAQKWGVSYFSNGTGAAMTLQSTVYALVDNLLETAEKNQSSDQVETRMVDMVTQALKEVPTKQDLYPNAPSSPQIALAIPLEQYAGSYTHLGYGTLTLSAKEDGEGPYLYSSIERVFSREVTLRHVNAEHWIGTSWAGAFPLKRRLRARSNIAADGKVESFEIALEPAMTDTLFLFVRDT